MLKNVISIQRVTAGFEIVVTVAGGKVFSIVVTFNFKSFWKTTDFHCGDFGSNDLLKENWSVSIVVTGNTVICWKKTT